jgi:putative oxidoreductase
MRRLARLRTPRLEGPIAYLPTVVALATGLIFVSFGVGHFARHAAEVNDFRRYEVPFASSAVWAVGVVELGGGVALLVGLFVRPAAAALAGDMAGVIATAGRVEGGWLNLGVAPLLLAGMVFLLWAGPGSLSLDAVLQRRAVTAERGREPNDQAASRSRRARKNSRAARRWSPASRSSL